MRRTAFTLGHSPDPDDAFMFYGLAEKLVNTEGLTFTHILQDIETLNHRALNQELDITAVSLHAYASILEHYALLPCGASIGDGYGPMVISKKPMTLSDLHNATIAVPGKMTTAFLTLRLCIGEFACAVLPFDAILQAVAEERFEAGLIIHEGQLTYQDAALRLVVDLGAWWKQDTGLPLPLGANVVKKSFGPACNSRLNRILKDSIQYGLEHRRAAVTHAMQYARDMNLELADRFVGMYVNHFTLDFGEAGREGVRQLLLRGHEAGIIPNPVELEFVA